jgi:hypothetical protein
VKSLLVALVGIYMLGVFANGAVIQYTEDPYGCKKDSSVFFICPWSPERERDPNQREITRRMGVSKNATLAEEWGLQAIFAHPGRPLTGIFVGFPRPGRAVSL